MADIMANKTVMLNVNVMLNIFLFKRDEDHLINYQSQYYETKHQTARITFRYFLRIDCLLGSLLMSHIIHCPMRNIKGENLSKISQNKSVTKPNCH